MINIDKGISIILHDWLNVGKDELIHFITDEAHMREAEAISRWAYGADAVLKTTILNSQQGLVSFLCRCPVPTVPRFWKTTSSR